MKLIVRPILKFIFGLAYEPILKEIRYKKSIIKGCYFSVFELDKKLRKYLNYKNGFYVELGANNGVDQSNTLYFEMKRGWKGILMEPALNNYLECLERRGKKNVVFCNACVSNEFKEKFIEFSFANLMSTATAINSDLPNINEHLENAKNFYPQKQHSLKFAALTTTLNDLLDEGNAPHTIDLLSLDVEGAELEVLKGIDFGKYSFKYILVESRDFTRLNLFFADYGYSFVEKFTSQDFLFAKTI